MRQILNESEIAQLQAHAPGAGIGHGPVAAVVKGTPCEIAVADERSEVARARDRWQAFRAVLHIAIVARGVPAKDAGHAPFELVLHQGLGEPPLALGASAHDVVLVAALDDVKTSHLLHKAVIEVDFDVQRVEHGNVDGEPLTLSPKKCHDESHANVGIKDVGTTTPSQCYCKPVFEFTEHIFNFGPFPV